MDTNYLKKIVNSNRFEITFLIITIIIASFFKFIFNFVFDYKIIIIIFGILWYFGYLTKIKKNIYFKFAK